MSDVITREGWYRVPVHEILEMDHVRWKGNVLARHTRANTYTGLVQSIDTSDPKWVTFTIKTPHSTINLSIPSDGQIEQYVPWTETQR